MLRSGARSTLTRCGTGTDYACKLATVRRFAAPDVSYRLSAS